MAGFAPSAQAQSLDPLTWSTPPEPAASLFGAAPPFRLTSDARSRERALTCLASAVYYEAANQPLQGQQAVAQVVLNRVRHVDFPKSVCGVVYQGASRPGCQFTFACDGSLDRPPSREGWRSALVVAERALQGFVEPSIGASTHYHTVYVHPLWDGGLRMVRRIGMHQFYRFDGALGDASTLVGVYAGEEPDVGLWATSARLRSSNPQRSARRGIAPAPPRSAIFSVWGLQVAMVRPSGDSVAIADADSQRPVVLVQPGT